MKDSTQIHPHTALRHMPKQERSERKVDMILQCAEEVFAEVGYEHATTNAIAVRAGVAIGTLYQFFDGKEGLLEAVAQRYIDQTREGVQGLLNPPDGFNPREFLADLLAMLLKYQDQRPYFLQCLGYNHSYSALDGAVKELHSALADQVVVLLERISKPASQSEIRLRAVTCVTIVAALLPAVVAAKTQERKRLAEEITVVLERYIGPGLK